jgi:hypothetical protein
VLIIAVIAGAGALAWSQRSLIGEVVASLDAAKPASVKLVPPAVPASGAPAKPAASANPGTDDTGAAPSDGANPAPPAAAGKPAQPAAGAGSEVGPAAPGAPVASASDNAGGSGALAMGKAVLHEEVANSTGDPSTAATSLKAAVAWRYVENGASGPAIEADLQVPERRLKITVTIHKNSDASLPASHLVEIKFDTPADLPGKGVEKLTSIFLKPTEERPGRPLVGAGVKVADGFFWIALSAADSDVSTNLALLRGGDWIDLPFTYATGQRAILTFQKGTEGDQVFQKAMAAWTAG